MASAIPAITGFASGLSGDPTAFNLIVKQQQKQRQKELLEKAGLPEQQVQLFQVFPELATALLPSQIQREEQQRLLEQLNVPQEQQALLQLFPRLAPRILQEKLPEVPLTPLEQAKLELTKAQAAKLQKEAQQVGKPKPLLPEERGLLEARRQQILAQVEQINRGLPLTDLEAQKIEAQIRNLEKKTELLGRPSPLTDLDKARIGYIKAQTDLLNKKVQGNLPLTLKDLATLENMQAQTQKIREEIQLLQEKRKRLGTLTPIEQAKLKKLNTEALLNEKKAKLLDSRINIMQQFQQGVDPEQIAKGEKNKSVAFNQMAALAAGTGNMGQAINLKLRAFEEENKLKSLNKARENAKQFVDNLFLDPLMKDALKKQIDEAPSRQQVFNIIRQSKNNPAIVVGYEVGAGLLQDEDQVRARLAELGVKTEAQQNNIIEQLKDKSVLSRFLNFIGIDSSITPESPLAQQALRQQTQPAAPTEQQNLIPAKVRIKGKVVNKLLTPELFQKAKEAGLIVE